VPRLKILNDTEQRLFDVRHSFPVPSVGVSLNCLSLFGMRLMTSSGSCPLLVILCQNGIDPSIFEGKWNYSGLCYQIAQP